MIQPPTRLSLSRRKIEVLLRFESMCRRNGRAPSIRELACSLRRSPTVVLDHLRDLQRLGHIALAKSGGRKYVPVHVTHEDVLAIAIRLFDFVVSSCPYESSDLIDTARRVLRIEPLVRQTGPQSPTILPVQESPGVPP